MDHDLARQIEETHRKTQQTRLQFLTTELEVCFSTIDFGTFELEQGNRDMADNEALLAARGIATIEKFLPELDDAGERHSIQIRLDKLRQSLEAFELKLKK